MDGWKIRKNGAGPGNDATAAGAERKRRWNESLVEGMEENGKRKSMQENNEKAETDQKRQKQCDINRERGTALTIVAAHDRESG